MQLSLRSPGGSTRPCRPPGPHFQPPPAKLQLDTYPQGQQPSPSEFQTRPVISPPFCSACRNLIKHSSVPPTNNGGCPAHSGQQIKGAEDRQRHKHPSQPPRPLALALNPTHCRPRSTCIVCGLWGGLRDQCPSPLRKPAIGKVLESQKWSKSIRKGLPVTGGELFAFSFLVCLPGSSVVRTCLPMRETQVPSLSGEDPLEEEMATHSRILAWEIPQTGAWGVGHSPWVTHTAEHACTPFMSCRRHDFQFCKPQRIALKMKLSRITMAGVP